MVKPDDENKNKKEDKNSKNKDKNESEKDHTSFMSSKKEEENSINKNTNNNKQARIEDNSLRSSERELQIEKNIEKIIEKKGLFAAYYSLDMLDFKDAIEKDKRGFLKLFLSMIINNNIAAFILQNDANSFYTKVSVLILSLSSYIFLNILLMFNSPSLHLYIGRIFEETFEPKYFVINMLLPFLLYLLALLFKKLTSLREFLSDQYTMHEIIEENKEKLLPGERILKLHRINTEISKFKRSLDCKAFFLTIIGSVLLFFNFMLVTSFCGIYENSNGSLILNIFISIIFTIIICSLIFLASTILRYFGIKKEDQLLYYFSSKLNPSYILYGNNRIKKPDNKEKDKEKDKEKNKDKDKDKEKNKEKNKEKEKDKDKDKDKERKRKKKKS